MEREKIIINIKKENLIEAEFMSSNFIDKETKNRAFINTIGAESAASYLVENGISIEPAKHMHSIKRVLEKTNIADIILPSIHIDVRVIFDENTIFVPKSHFENEIIPDVYMVLKYNGNNEKLDFIGYFQPNIIDFNQCDNEYFFVERTKLFPAESFINFILDFDGNTERNITEMELLRGRELSILASDDDITAEEYKEYLKLLVKSSVLRDSILEYDNFETLAGQVAHYMSTNSDFSATVSDISNSLTESSENNDLTSELPQENDNILTDKISSNSISDSVIELAGLAGEQTEELISSELNNKIPEMDISDLEYSNLTVDNILEEEKPESEPQKDELLLDNANIDDVNNQSDPHIESELSEEFGDLDNTMSHEDLQDYNSDNYENLLPSEDIFDTDIDFGADNLISFDDETEVEENTGNFSPLDYLQDINNQAQETSEPQDKTDENEEVQNTQEDNSGELENISDYIDKDQPKSSFEKFEPNALKSGMSFENKNTHEAESVDFNDIVPNSDAVKNMEYKEYKEDYSLLDFKNSDNNAYSDDNNIEETSTEENIMDFADLSDAADTSEEADITDLNDFDDFSDEKDISDLNDIDNLSDENDISETSDIKDIQNEDLDFSPVDGNELNSNSDIKSEQEEQEEDNSGFEDFNNLYEFENFGTASEDGEDLVNNEDIDFNDGSNAEVNIDEEPEEEHQEEVYIDDEIINNSEVIENSVVISDKDFEPGEILLDINRTDLPEFENSELGDIYNNEDLNDSDLKNDVRISSNSKGFNISSISPKYGIIGLILIVATAGVILFSVSKFMHPTEDNKLANGDLPDSNLDTTSPEAINITPDDIVMNNDDNQNIPNAPTPSKSGSTSASGTKTAKLAKQDANTALSNKQQNYKEMQNIQTTRHIPPTDFLTIKKLSWEVPDYISYNAEYRQYFQSAGKGVKTALSSDILLATDYTYSNTIKLSVTFDKTGKFKEAKIVTSSGSSQVDKIILRSVNQTLNILKAPPSIANDESTTVILKIIL